MVKLYPLEEGEEESKFRLMMRLANYTVYKIKFQLECGENSQFADGREKFEKIFTFTKNNINLNSMSADIETISQKDCPLLYVDFSVRNSEKEVKFTLK